MAAAALGFWLLGSGATETGRPRSNVLLVSVDTLRADHLGTYGYHHPTSPRIDALAREGLQFGQVICQNTNTNPSHASMLTGLYPRSHGNWDNWFLLADDVPTLGEVFRDAGYRTAAFVSGYTLKKRICGLDRGFELYDDDFVHKERAGDLTTARALDWLHEHAGEPFFLFVHLFDPHGPYTPPPEHADRFAPGTPPRHVPLERIPRYQRLPVDAPPEEVWTDLERYIARYDAEIHFADAQVGRLLDALDELGIDDNTVILFTSDHGEAIDERFHLLDHGGGVGDEEIRVPLILRLPGRQHAGRHVDAQAQLIDVAPTLAAAAGLSFPEPVQGVDLLPAIDRPGHPHAHAFTETRVIPLRWRDRDYQLSVHDTLKAVRRPDAKLVVFPGVAHNYLELYDLTSDSLERHNVFTQRHDLADALLRSLETFLDLPSRFNAKADPDSDAETREIFRTLGYVD